jgi:hypothetical protein
MLRQSAHRLRRLDARLLAAPGWLRATVVLITLLSMLAVSLPKVPRPFVDYRQISWLRGIDQPSTFGTDTIADAYEARVVLNDVRDMYTKRGVEQTPLEAATWSKEASAPYPPAVLLAEAGLYAIGEWLGVGLYGMVLLLAFAFVGMSLWYCLRTRWYVFPLLYLNFAYFSERFVAVQDGSYLVMLVVVMCALLLARAGRPGAAHLAVAVATTMKLSPLFYLAHLGRMRTAHAIGFAAILCAGLVLPVAIWENYLYIYGFHDSLKGDAASTVGALSVAAPFALVLAYADMRRGFDWEDRIGWSLVPFAMFLAFKMNAARHLLIVLLVPDKRGVRSAVAAVALAVPVLLPGVVRFNASAPIATCLLILVLVDALQSIGWKTIREDLRRPLATLRLMFRPA